MNGSEDGCEGAKCEGEGEGEGESEFTLGSELDESKTQTTFFADARFLRMNNSVTTNRRP